MKIIVPGGTGQVGVLLSRAFTKLDHEVVVLSRAAPQTTVDQVRYELWDGRTLGPWKSEVSGADVVINLAGRSVNCRYTKANLAAMMSSRVDSTRVVGEAIAKASMPPKLWLQMSTATIYAHRFDAANDEATGIIGGGEPGAPEYWGFSVEIAKAWEAEQEAANTPSTRKVALRTAMVMSPDQEGIFDVLRGLTRAGLGGSIGGGEQYVSWIHDADFIRAVLFLIEREDLSGPINVCAPQPLTQRAFMAAMRDGMHKSMGLPATKWMAEVGAFFMRSDTELLLKSRRVLPGRLLKEGFAFEQPSWPPAVRDLLDRFG